MKVFLAGNKSIPMKVFLAGEHEIKNGKEMILYLSGTFPRAGYLPYAIESVNILESYYYLRDNIKFIDYIQYFDSFLLDSGAFTFLNGLQNNNDVDWDSYVEEYGEFIKKHNISLFFELDIDSIVGLDEVERLREKLELITGKKPIPVWHRNRGKEYFIKMCKEYPYVAIGGIVTKEIPRKKYETAFPWFIQIAHKYGAKIHGLGYTNIANLKKYHFDSVDSTAWLYGNRGGYLYKFNPRTGLMEQIRKEGYRLKSRKAAINNFNEWIKFSKYAEQFL